MDLSDDDLEVFREATGHPLMMLRALSIWHEWDDELPADVRPGVMSMYVVRNALHEDVMRLTDDLPSPDHHAFILSGRMRGVSDGTRCRLGMARARDCYAALEAVGTCAEANGLDPAAIASALRAWRPAEDVQLLGCGSDWFEFWPRTTNGVDATRELFDVFPMLSDVLDHDEIIHQSDSCGTVFLNW